MTIVRKGLVVAFATIALGLAAPASAAPEAKLGIKRLVLAHGIDDREPQQPATTFQSNDDRVYAFLEIDNPAKTGGKQVFVVFEPPSGPAHAEIPLAVGTAPRYRTWAFTRRAHEAGEWSVVVRDTEHRVLARQTFTVAK